ncbi:homoserine kinase [Thalassotalea agarivorans]|uniref:Homoserine kinase n=1 Tax=Thalassotalea agarivorans TaxID=349064 RepID=A0A1I0AR72_THASX|nr:homoserine kinase [Thalassotalea agarivorans]SES96231.1 homoserine kinase [Thalassotalea agarivorans]
MKVSVFAPASIGNVSVGFDVLGLAVTPVDGTLLGDVVTVEESQIDTLDVVGEFADKLPKEKEQNIVWHCLLLFNAALKAQAVEVKTVALSLDKKMPVGSGLGSSACSVVAALVALNEFYQKPLSSEHLLKLMGEMEANISGSLHYDNVAPCFLGGLQLMVPDEQVITRDIPLFSDCYYVMAYPGITVNTKAAREILPSQYSREQLIAFGQNLATFIDASYRQDKAMAFAMIKDVVAEPYRKSLLPGFEQAKQAVSKLGSLAAGISGSGPTMFSVYETLEQAETAATWLKQNYLQSDQGFVHVCKADEVGARIID